MKEKENHNQDQAQELIDDFLGRTGISDGNGNAERRYLWTDAFAVQACFALWRITNKQEYYNYARQLIDMVHNTLGRYRKDDKRKGWISGLSEEEGKEHPTNGGLRIGKKLPERAPDEPYDQLLEWERDGQYFHYLTRWFNALLQAFYESGQKKYALHAASLIKSAEKFISKRGDSLNMVWKMNTDLSQPVVETRGAHDPLEGLVCVLSAMDALPDCIIDLGNLEQDLKDLCKEQDWYTSDSLGIGGLLLNVARVMELILSGNNLPRGIRPDKLFGDALSGLRTFSVYEYEPEASAENRLAFRECGLSLGVRVVWGMGNKYPDSGVDNSKLDLFVPLADEIEDFWLRKENQESESWNRYLDINSVTLACSVLSRFYPGAFCAPKRLQNHQSL